MISSSTAFSKPFNKENNSKKDNLKEILKYLNYKINFKEKNNQIQKSFNKNNIINIKGWIFTEKEVLGIY